MAVGVRPKLALSKPARRAPGDAIHPVTVDGPLARELAVRRI